MKGLREKNKHEGGAVYIHMRGSAHPDIAASFLFGVTSDSPHKLPDKRSFVGVTEVVRLPPSFRLVPCVQKAGKRSRMMSIYTGGNKQAALGRLLGLLRYQWLLYLAGAIGPTTVKKEIYNK